MVAVVPAERAATAPADRILAPRVRRATTSARVRILGWYVLLMVAATAVSIVLGRGILRDRVVGDADQRLTTTSEEVRRLAATGEFDDATAVFAAFMGRNVPTPGDAWLGYSSGQLVRSAGTAPAGLFDDREATARWRDLRQPERGEIETRAGPVRYLAVPLVDEAGARATFVGLAPLTPGRREVDDVVFIMALASLSVVLGASALAWGVAGRVLSPVRTLTDAARAIEEHDLSKRIEVSGSDEVAELAATFNAMLDRLEAGFAVQRDFVNDAGHELRTPITIIRGQLELLGDDPSEREEVVALVTDELDRMSRMVNDLLVLAKAERPGFVVLSPLPVDTFLREILSKAQSTALRRWQIEATVDAEVLADRDRLTQAMMNLTNNAVTHSNDGDEIFIGAARRDGYVDLWVRDCGPGVPEADRERIFERFARAGGDRFGRRSTGTGLGLAIVRAIIEAHGGAVSLSSPPTGGAIFTLSLPQRGAPE